MKKKFENLENLKITDVWIFPFTKDPEGLSVYIWDSKHHVCFNFIDNSLELYNRVVDLLNGVQGVEPFPEVGYSDSHISVFNSNDENAEPKPILLVRGWGYLTGTGALNLPADIALRLQKELILFCCWRLKGLSDKED